MNCLKCGKEVGSSRVFCDDCLLSMDSYPIEPGTPVHIHQRTPRPEKPVRRSSTGYADTVRSLRKVIRWLCVALAGLTFIVCVLCGCLYYALNHYNKEDTIGKNYTAVETDTQP